MVLKVNLNSEQKQALSELLGLAGHNTSESGHSSIFANVKYDFTLAEKLHDYLLKPQDGLPKGVRRFGPEGNEKDALVITIGLHPGEIGPGSMAVLPILAAHLGNKLTKPVYVISMFPDKSANFLQDAKLLAAEERYDDLNKLVKQTRYDNTAYPPLDPNRLSTTELNRLLDPNYHPEIPTYQRIQELLPILKKANYLLDIHSATAPFTNSPNLTSQFPDHQDFLEQLSKEPATINTVAPMENTTNKFLAGVPIRRIVSDMVSEISQSTSGSSMTFKQFMADVLSPENPPEFITGIEAGHHYTPESFETCADFVARFAENTGAAKQKTFLGKKTEAGTNFLVFNKPNILKTPDEGKWYFTPEAFKKLGTVS